MRLSRPTALRARDSHPRSSWRRPAAPDHPFVLGTREDLPTRSPRSRHLLAGAGLQPGAGTPRDGPPRPLALPKRPPHPLASFTAPLQRPRAPLRGSRRRPTPTQQHARQSTGSRTRRRCGGPSRCLFQRNVLVLVRGRDHLGRPPVQRRLLRRAPLGPRRHRQHAPPRAKAPVLRNRLELPSRRGCTTPAR